MKRQRMPVPAAYKANVTFSTLIWFRILPTWSTNTPVALRYPDFEGNVVKIPTVVVMLMSWLDEKDHIYCKVKQTNSLTSE
jgi:hypothetical protein